MDWTASVASGTPKPAWDAMPRSVRGGVEERVGRIVSVVGQPGGFTPSVAVRVRLDGGAGVFVKATDGQAFPAAARAHRREAEILASLEPYGEVPRLVDWFEHDGWTVLILEEINGRHPQLPWRDHDLDRTLAGLQRLSQRLTPSPVPVAGIVEELQTELIGWRTLRDSPHQLAAFNDSWVAEHLAVLADIEARWSEAAAGDTLLHIDLRADQILLTDNSLCVVDWAQACIGAAWIDPLFLFPSVGLQGGPDIAQLVDRCALTAAAPPGDLLTVGVALAGFFVWKSSLPQPPGLPTLRAFQHAQGQVVVAWLKTQLTSDTLRALTQR